MNDPSQEPMRCWGRLSIVACSLLMSCTVSGCQPPLSLEAVNEAAAKAIRRTDEFQAAASRGTTVVVVGNHGVILTSRDSGAHWRRHTLDQWPSLIAVSACGASAFAAISYEGSLWLSLDNAATWHSSAIGSSIRPQAITCDPHGTIWVVGEAATLLSSRDNGAHWESTTLDPQDLFLTTIQFVDGQHGFITGEFGIVEATSDGGATWQKRAPMPGEMYPQAAHFVDASHGWAVGLNGTILETVDGAMHWSANAVDVSSPLYGITSDSDSAFVVGGDGTLLLRTHQLWSRVAGPRMTHSYLRVILRTEDGDVLVGGGGGLLARLPRRAWVATVPEVGTKNE